VKGSVDSRWHSMFKPPPEPGDAVAFEEPGPDSPRDPEELGPCASRPHPTGWTGVYVLNGRENTRAFQYVHLGFEEFSADGQAFVVEFNVNVAEKWRMTVKGRKLWPIFLNLHHHKLEWIRKADRDFGEDGHPVITAIAIEPVAEPAR
jgi:hypothetical protein